MNIITKFDYKEEVYAIVNDKITKVIVHQIIINVMKSTMIWYELNWDDDKYDKRPESEVYKTKEDIIK